MSYFKKLTFLKVLTTIAWADGEMTQSELNVLKSFFRKFDLDRDDLAELKHYLEAPVSKKEQAALYETMIAELSSPGDRKEIQQAMESMLHAHPRTGSVERELIEKFSESLSKTSFTKRSLGKFRNLLHGTIFQNARDKDPDMEKYFKRKVFKKIELKFEKLGKKINLSDDKVYYVCLLGALLATVAHVDDHFDETEKKALKKIMAEQFSFHGQELNVLFEVIEEKARGGFDFHEVVTEVNNLTPYSDRLKLVDAFFAIAAADGDLAYEEAEEIRRITKAMHVPHKKFIESKMKTLSRLR
ncbi:MAG: TerB family tellurite resistance protein [Nitrospinaceae bacterium]